MQIHPLFAEYQLIPKRGKCFFPNAIKCIFNFVSVYQMGSIEK